MGPFTLRSQHILLFALISFLSLKSFGTNVRTEALQCVDCGLQNQAVSSDFKDNLAEILDQDLEVKKRPARQARPRTRTVRRTPPPASRPASGNMIDRLVSAAKRSALALRETSDSVRSRTGKVFLAGDVAKGKCFQAVKDALFWAGWTKTNPKGNNADQAIEAHTKGFLKKEGFKLRPDLLWAFRNNKNSKTTKLPASVLVYSGGNGHRDGHIEIFVGGTYYSDMMSVNSSVARSNHHRLVAVYTKDVT